MWEWPDIEPHVRMKCIVYGLGVGQIDTMLSCLQAQTGSSWTPRGCLRRAGHTQSRPRRGSGAACSQACLRGRRNARLVRLAPAHFQVALPHLPELWHTRAAKGPVSMLCLCTSRYSWYPPRAQVILASTWRKLSSVVGEFGAGEAI